MNYRKIYEQITNSRLNNIPSGYKERHHILPKSIGGGDEINNLVYLTAREHFICHYLLTKMFKEGTFEWYKMNHAFMFMKSDNSERERYFNSKLYDSKRINFSKVMSESQEGSKNSQFGRIWICNVDQEVNKKIHKSELEFYYSRKWIKGRNIWNKVYCNRCLTKIVRYYGSKHCKSCDQSDKFGDRFSTSKLSTTQVREIKRKLGSMSNVAIGKEYNINHSTISYIRSGKLWSDVN